MAAYNYIEQFVRFSQRSILNKFQQFIMVLMRLRLNLPIQDLAYRFCVSTSTVSRLFLMFHRMKPLVFWPSREELRRTMPMCFREKFGTKVAVVIDCFEVFTDRPSGYEARAATWSSYKHHNTVKFLIGICPQGVISFISRAWGGRVSDKHLTENCGFLDKLLPGDLVLADRGFNISDAVGLHCAKVEIPAFMKGRKQLSPLDVEETKKLANVRIHIERVIGHMRQYYKTIDKIAVVCSALTNLYESVVPFD